MASEEGTDYGLGQLAGQWPKYEPNEELLATLRVCGASIASPEVIQKRTRALAAQFDLIATAAERTGDGDEHRGAAMSDQHPEDRCHRCGGPNVVWSAPSPLWNAVMRPPSRQGHPAGEPWDGIICPKCFIELAQAAGCRRWVLTSPDFPTDGAVFTDGRVWSDAKQLWVGSSDE